MSNRKSGEPEPPPMLAIAIVIVAVALAINTVTASAQPASGPVAPPTGVAVVVDTRDLSRASWKQALNNSSVSGIAVQIHWSDLEPESGQFDWTKLDDVFGAATAAHKWVQLLIFPGFFTPSWALDGVKADSFAYQYGPGAGMQGQLPMPWDQTYLDRWCAFVRALGARYASTPSFRVIAASGPTSVSAEFTLPNSPEDVKQWQRDGYRPSLYVAAWQRVFHEYQTDFRRQFVSLSTGGGVGINEAGTINPPERARTRHAIIEQAMGILGPRLALQMSDVHAGPGPHLPDSETEDRLIIGYNGTVVTGFQMRTSAEADSVVMGAAGDPALALRRSIDAAMEPNASGARIDYLEIYERDVLAPELQPDLQYAASLFKQSPAAAH